LCHVFLFQSINFIKIQQTVFCAQKLKYKNIKNTNEANNPYHTVCMFILAFRYTFYFIFYLINRQQRTREVVIKEPVLLVIHRYTLIVDKDGEVKNESTL